jgi:hypothetical protein
MEFTYRAFDLTIQSDLKLPDLPETDGEPEVHIRRGVIPEWSGDTTIRYGDRFKIRGQEWSVNFKSLPFASIIKNGNLVQYQADPENGDLTRLHVLGSCIGALLFQRGLVPLHGNSIATSQGAAILAGMIGAGKSATTLALLDKNHRLIADDISAVSFDDQQPRVVPGFPRLKLWKKTLDHFGKQSSEYARLRPELDKFHYPVDATFCSERQLLRAIYVLNPCESPGVTVRGLSGIAKLDAISRHLYKIRLEDAARNWPVLMDKMCRLADSVKVNIVERPLEGNSIDAVANAIRKDLDN